MLGLLGDILAVKNIFTLFHVDCRFIGRFTETGSSCTPKPIQECKKDLEP